MEITRLIERCRQGDTEALGYLYKAYAQKMRGVCRRYISDEQAIDDVLHDAFVIIFTSFDRLRDARKAEPWIMAITRNVASKYKEHRNAVSTVPIEDVEKIVVPEQESSTKGIPFEEVMRMVDRLPEGYARVFKLSVFEGMTHKEIAAVLGIEPHSSSSQLSRAKKMLQKALARYWVWWLLLLLLPASYYLYNYIKPVYGQSLIIKEQSITPSIEESASPTELHNPLATKPKTAVDAVPRHKADSIPFADKALHFAQGAERTDTIATVREMPAPNIRRNTESNIAEQKRQPLPAPTFNTKPVRWGIGLAYSGELNKNTDANKPTSIWVRGYDHTGIGSGASLREINKWSDYIGYLYEASMTEQEREIHFKIAEANIEHGENEIQRKVHHDAPLTISIALRWQIAPRWSVETGINYTRLTSQFTTGIPQAGFVDMQKVHYLGLPLQASYQLLRTKRWGLYSSLGATAEIPLRAMLTTDYRLNGESFYAQRQSLHAPLQWSVGAGVGLQYDLSSSVGLFAEPRLQYFIPMKGKIETFRTEHPLNLVMPLGIRFTW